MSARILHVLNLGLLGALFAGSVAAFPALPAEIPAHFDLGGRVTRWTTATAFSWFAIPFLALLLSGLMYGIAALLPRSPHLFNFPEKKDFLALPAAYRAPVIDEMQRFIYILTTPLIALFGSIQWTVYRTATGGDPRALIPVMLVLSLALAPFSLAYGLPRIRRALRTQIERHAREEGG